MTGKTIAEQLSQLKVSNVPEGLPKASQPVRAFTEEMFEVIRLMPGISVAEIADLMPHVPRRSLSGLLSQNESKGRLRSEVAPNPKAGVRGVRNTHKRFWVVEGTPVPQARTSDRKKALGGRSRQPTEAALKHQIDTLKAAVSALEAWKADAVARFPDLAVDPLVLEARQIVAETVIGDADLRDQVIAGHRDTTLVVRATVEALRRARGL